jgi:hypothetical protein
MIRVALRPEAQVIGEGRLSGEEMALLREWVDLNRDVLLGYWNQELFTDALIGRLRPVARG